MTNEEILCKLRQDIRLRGLTSATEEEYLMAANTFIKFYDNQPIFNMTEQEIRKYLIYLLEVKKLLLRRLAKRRIKNDVFKYNIYSFHQEK